MSSLNIAWPWETRRSKPWATPVKPHGRAPPWGRLPRHVAVWVPVCDAKPPPRALEKFARSLEDAVPLLRGCPRGRTAGAPVGCGWCPVNGNRAHGSQVSPYREPGRVTAGGPPRPVGCGHRGRGRRYGGRTGGPSPRHLPSSVRARTRDGRGGGAKKILPRDACDAF